MSFYNDKMIELANNGVILDIGSNLGMYLEPMSKVATEVYAFEPHPDNIAVINEKALSFPNVKIVPAALDSKDGQSALFVCSRNHGQHTLSYFVAADPRWGHSLSNIIKVPAYKLDTFVTQNNITNITGIKIDVEGAEENVLEGAVETLRNNSAIISLETHNPINTEKIANILISCDYIFWGTDKTLVTHIEPDRHYFCVKKGSNINPFIGE